MYTADDMVRRTEYLKVQELGRKIGYGNLMAMASLLMCLDNDNVPMHIPTVYPFLNSEGKINMYRNLDFQMNDFNYLFGTNHVIIKRQDS